MLEPDIVITKQADDSRFNPDGTVTPQVRVAFMVGKHGPFFERFDKQTYTAFVRDEKLNAFAREVR